MLETRGAADRVASEPPKEIEREIGMAFRKAAPDLLIVDMKMRELASMAVNKYGIASALFSVTLLEGLAPVVGGASDDPHRGELPVLVFCPQEFDLPRVGRKSGRYYIEPSIDLQRNETQPFPWHKVDERKPLLYCSLGSESYQYEQSANLFRAIIEAMREKPDWQVVLAMGRQMAASLFHAVPENVLLVNWAPQLEMLKRASIMITHGGLGAVKECIFFGVPMIVFPCKWDQPSNAARVVARGLGVRGNIKNPSARQIHSLIDAIAKDPMFKSRIDAMSKTFREIEDSGRGVKIIERILGGPQKALADSMTTEKQGGYYARNN
jgi:UDP:flavonoid glycosyltransferase YjiC (YdhE family)